MLASSEASAQGLPVQKGTFALNNFQPAPAGDRFFTIQQPDTTGHLDLNVGLLAEYSRDPLVLYRVNDNTNPEISREFNTNSAVVSDQLFLHAGASLNLFNRLNFNLDFPIALLNQGDNPSDNAVAYQSPDGVSAGDLRLGGRLSLLNGKRGYLNAAIAANLWLPTGDDEQFAGDGLPRGGPQVVLGGKYGSFVWGANVGLMFRDVADLSAEDAALTGGTAGTEVQYAGYEPSHQLTYGIGVAGVSEDGKLQVGPELYGSVNAEGDDAFESRASNLEAILGIKYRVGPVVLGGAAGPGITSGVGTPSIRAVLSLTYAPGAEDRDEDGISDGNDACPDEPGAKNRDPRKNGCPDRDGDGVLDKADACPDMAGLITGDPATDGCPDTDRDGIFDNVDACPEVAGVPNENPLQHGCPVTDRDNDGIPDNLDACVDVPGPQSADPRKNGCPPDRDGDGIPDDRDACPDRQGKPDPNPQKNGCPPDTDGDGILDSSDACPNEKGPASADPNKNGCPMVRVEAGKIQILEQIQFKTNSDVILPESDALMTQVANVFKEHLEIKKVLVEGHTDSTGNKMANKGLSQRRAASVKRWLVNKGGVDTRKLDTQGFGQENPIDSNDTPEGRQKNRRVEFKIVKTGDPNEPLPPMPKAAPKPKTGGTGGATKPPAPKAGGKAPAPKAPAPKAPKK